MRGWLLGERQNVAKWTIKITETGPDTVRVDAKHLDGSTCSLPNVSIDDADTTPAEIRKKITDDLRADHQRNKVRKASMASKLTGWESALEAGMNAKETQ